MIPRWHNILIAVICLLMGTYLITLMGCAPSRKGVCRHKALFANSVVGEYFPVYTVIGKTETGEYHA